MKHLTLRLLQIFTLVAVFHSTTIEAQTCPAVTLTTQAEVDNYVLSNFPCTSIDGDLIFDGFDITDITDFYALEDISGALIVRNTSLNSLVNMFPKLTSIGGDLRIRNNASLVSINGGFPALGSVGSELIIRNNDVLVSIHSFENLLSVGSNFRIRENNLLPEITGFYKLSTVGGDFGIQNNNALLTLDGFSSLISIGILMNIGENDQLVSISGFPMLIEVGDDLQIRQNDALSMISGFSSLEEVRDDFEIIFNDALISIEGFDVLKTVVGDFEIEGNDMLSSIPMFAYLESVGDDFEIINNDDLTQIIGFNSLTNVDDFFEIRNNNTLLIINGFQVLTDVGDDFEIRNNDDLPAISGFTLLQEVVGDFEIEDNDLLKTIDGFINLKNVGDDFEIRNNDELLTVTGFNHLTIVEDAFEIENNDILKSIPGFGKLQTIGVPDDGDLEIQNNDALTKISGFGALTTIGDNIDIENNDALLSIKGFENLTDVGTENADGDVEIINNASLESIYAFKALSFISDELRLENNPNLFFCCGLTHIVETMGYASAAILGNAPGCNSEMEILAICAATLSDCTPNCKASINAGLNQNGKAILRPSDWVTDTASCSSGLEITVETTWGGPIFGPQVIGMNGAFSIHACPYLFQTLKIRTRSASGTCWTELTFKQGNGPTIDPVPAQTIYCFDPLVNGPDPNEERSAWIPCSEEVPAVFVTDWVTPIDCEPGVNDTVKIIYREWEAYDKEGRRGVQFDTLYVFQFPEITATSIYCEQKDTTYCGDTTLAIGPYIVYPDLNGGCDTTYLVNVTDVDNDQMLEFNPTKFATKCGINVHVDAWKFPGDCEIQYRVEVELKQDCYGPAQTICIVPTAGVDPNFAEQLGPGYWKCEFWLIDIDTIGPEIVCKGDELFTGPFAIENWQLAAGLANPILPAPVASNLPELDFFNLDYLPYELIVESEASELFKGGFDTGDEIDASTIDVDDTEGEGDAPEAEENFFFLAPYKAEAAAIYQAREDVEFNFVWDFTIEQPDDFALATSFDEFRAPADACVSIAYFLNGVGYRIVQGEEGFCEFGRFESAANLAMNVNILDPVSVFQSQFGRVNIPLKAGDELIILAIWDSNSNATFRILGPNVAPTSTTECAAHAYIPPLRVIDDWSGAKQAKATVEEYGNVQLEYNPETGCFESHLKIKFPFRYEPYKITYEAFDSCHNVSYDSCYITVKDVVKPVPVMDKGVTVSLSDKKVWLDAESFNEGSSDNCGVNLLLVRRTDWYESCVDLCSDVEYLCVTEHEDTLWKVKLEGDKNVDPVEAHYQKTLDWLSTDNTPCAEIIYNAWQYDLIKHAMQNCFEHPYSIDDHAIRELIYECKYDLEECFKPVPLHPGEEIFTARFTPELLDIYQQIGGGWSDAVPFSCEDACGPVTVEILVMDYWCNWATAWTDVWVEDKTPVKVVKDVVDIDEEDAISCKTYRENRYTYPEELHPVSLEYIVNVAKSGDTVALSRLDDILGGYCKAWQDPYGNYVDASGETIECDIPFEDSQCFCKDTTVSMLVYDEHHGYIWKDSTYRFCYYDSTQHTFQKGIIIVNCAENVYCEQQVWCDIDHCGEGYIYRKFKIWQSCPASFYNDPEVPDSLKHEVDTIVRRQRIKIGNFCPIDKGMFDVPADLEVYTCQIEYGDDGNVIGDAGPENTGYATYKFDDDCRLIGINHSDKVFKIVGGDGFCYKIIRTWYFADWCDGEPADDNWWEDGSLVTEYCEQKIFVRDTTAPVCVINGPMDDGGQIEVGACYFNLEVTVDVSDECGVSKYYWEIKDIKEEGSPVLIDSDEGSLSGEAENTFDITSDDLPAGLYKLIVTVVDECNNEGFCQYFFEVVNVKKPAAICITTLTARLNPMDLDQNGEVDTATVIVWAEEFDRSSEVACDDEYLEYRVELLDGIDDDDTFLDDTSYIELGCDHVGVQMVRLWVISQPSGTVDFCDVLLVVQSDFSGCVGNQSGEKGQISNVTDMHDETSDPYKEMMGKKDVEISGDAGMPASIGVEGYRLEQNRPNPFQTETRIGFVLAESGLATVTIYDIRGKVLRSIQGDFSKGYNEVRLNKESLGTSSIMYYQLQSGDYTETRKMIMIQ